MAEFFETELDVYPVGTGTVANGLCASILCTPYGAIYCAEISHLHSSECGGTEFWSGGSARSVPLPTVDGKIAVATLVETIEAGALRAADPPGRALSLTQGTEAGTVYTVREVRELAAAAHAKGLLVHMDGARFANADRAPRVHAGRAHLEGGRRRPVVRRDEERRALRRGRRLLQPRPRPRRSATAGAGPAITTRRCASSRPSGSPSSRTTSGSGAPVTRTRWPRASARAWPTSRASGSRTRPRSTSC